MLSLVTLVSGAFAGLTSSLMFYPFEVIEARQQVDLRLKTKALYDALTFVLKTEGISGVYVGWQAAVFGNAFNWSLYFTLYDSLLSAVSVGHKAPGVLAQLLVGIVTGVISCSIVNPFWVIKYRMVKARVSQSKDGLPGFWGTVRQIVQLEGVARLWAGVGPSCFGSLCGAIQFLLHSHLKRSAIVVNSAGLILSLAIFISGCLSSLAATVLTYPYQVVRSRVQVAKKADMERGIVQFVRKQYQEEGIWSFYAGLYTNLFRQIPTSGCMLVVLELTSWALHRLFAPPSMHDTYPHLQ